MSCICTFTATISAKLLFTNKIHVHINCIIRYGKQQKTFIFWMPLCEKQPTFFGYLQVSDYNNLGEPHRTDFWVCKVLTHFDLKTWLYKLRLNGDSG